MYVGACSSHFICNRHIHRPVRAMQVCKHVRRPVLTCCFRAQGWRAVGVKGDVLAVYTGTMNCGEQPPPADLQTVRAPVGCHDVFFSLWVDTSLPSCCG